jgi:thiamine biosynthesis lipoprotein
VRRIETVMGLPVSVDVRRCAGDIGPVVDLGFAWLRAVDERFSPFRMNSEACRWDRGELPLADLSQGMIEVLDICADYERRSGGAFRSRLPGRSLDLCGVVKGWAVQHLAELLLESGARHFCVNAGGDLVTVGEPEPGRAWSVGIRHPERADRMCAVLRPGDGAIATSGNYERGSHILDGRTGLPARGLRSMTVLAADLTTADVTATAAFAMGADGIAWAAAQPGCLVFAVDDDRQVHRSPGLDELLVQPENDGRSGWPGRS